MENGVLIERIRNLDLSRRGFLSTITRVCNEIERRIVNYSNFAEVNKLQGQLHNAWNHYQNCCRQYFMLLDENCEKCYEVSSQYESQKMRKLSYDQKIKYFMESASSRLNAQALQQQQGAEDKRRAMEIEMKKTEIEIKQKELELELTLLEYESQLVQSEGGFTTETRVICESQDASVTHASHAPSKEVLQTTQPSNVYRADQMSLFTSVSGSSDAYASTITCVNPPPSREIPPVLGGYQPPPSSFSSAPCRRRRRPQSCRRQRIIVSQAKREYP